MEKIQKTLNKIIEKTLNKIYIFTLWKRTQIIGFSWQFGFMLYLIGGYICIYPIVSYFFTIILFEFHFISIWSLIIFFFSFLLSGIAYGYRISISEKFLIFYPTIFFIPYGRIKASLSDICFKNKCLFNKNSKICIYHEDDPWCEMGFCDWVEIKNYKKSYAIGNNNNYEILLQKIKKTIELKTNL